MTFRPMFCALFGLAILPARGAGLPKLEVSAKSAVILDAESGEVLWAKDAETPRYPASTTKIMTALLLIEHAKPDDVIVAPADIESVKESSMHLKPGERVTAHDMLYALLLRSANDGCVAVADHVAGSVPAFAAMMNARARELGCTHTHFDNPNGLNDTKHTISAHDLALIAREAMRHPEFREVVRLVKHRITRSIDTKDTWMVNRNKWLRKDPTADGIKTGWTIPAGHCYVGSATRQGFRVITVVLKSDHWQEDHKRMLHWAFASFKPEYAVAAGETKTLIAATESGKGIRVAMSGPAYCLRPKSESPVPFSFAFRPAANLAKGDKLASEVNVSDKVGEIVISAPGVEYALPAIALEPSGQASGPIRKSGLLGFPTLLIGGVLGAGAVAMRRKARKMNNGWPHGI